MDVTEEQIIEALRQAQAGVIKGALKRHPTEPGWTAAEATLMEKLEGGAITRIASAANPGPFSYSYTTPAADHPEHVRLVKLGLVRKVPGKNGAQLFLVAESKAIKALQQADAKAKAEAKAEWDAAHAHITVRSTTDVKAKAKPAPKKPKPAPVTVVTQKRKPRIDLDSMTAKEILAMPDQTALVAQASEALAAKAKAEDELKAAVTELADRGVSLYAIGQAIGLQATQVGRLVGKKYA